MPFDVQAALAAGYSQDEINSFLQQKQMTGILRYPAMAGSEALSGLESWESLPAEGINWLTSKIAPSFPQVPDIHQYTDQLGLTNNISLIPGMGPYPEAERVGAGAMRGVGASSPALAMGPPGLLALGAGAAGGAIGQLVGDASGSPLMGAIAGGGVGLLGGGGASLFREGDLSVPEQLSNVKQAIGAPNADIYTAGRQLQNDLAQQQWLGAGGFGSGTALPQATVNSILKAKPMQAANMVLKDPDTLSTLRSEMPDTVDQLAGGMIWQNPMQWNRMPSKGQDALLPNEEHQQMLEDALSTKKTAAVAGSGVAEPLAATLAGGILGAGLSHFLHLPFGEYMGGEIGSALALGADTLRSRAVAAAIVNPWVRGATAAGTLGGIAGSQQPPLSMPPSNP